MKPESKFYAELKEKQLEGMFIQRVENSIDTGTPDFYFCSKGWPQGWCELKVMTMPKKDSTKIKIPFQPGQYPWLKRARQAGVLVVLLIKTDEGIYGFWGRDICREYSRYDFDKLSVHFPGVNERALNVNGRHTIRSWLMGL